jgi:hypothetical protein
MRRNGYRGIFITGTVCISTAPPAAAAVTHHIPNGCLRHLRRRLYVYLALFLSLCLVVTFLTFLKGRTYNKLTKPQQGFQISSKSTSEALMSFTGELVETTTLQIVQKAHREKEFVECKSVWLSCMSQHGISMYQSYRIRDLNFDVVFTVWISRRPLTAHSTLACCVSDGK